jgi:hypothetical protein
MLRPVCFLVHLESRFFYDLLVETDTKAVSVFDLFLSNIENTGRTQKEVLNTELSISYLSPGLEHHLNT